MVISGSGHKNTSTKMVFKRRLLGQNVLDFYFFINVTTTNYGFANNSNERVYQLCGVAAWAKG